MRQTILRRALLASCAVLLSISATAQTVTPEVQTGGTNTGAAGANSGGVQTPATNIGGATLAPGLGLSPTLGGPGVVPTPTPTGIAPNNGANPVIGVMPVVPTNPAPVNSKGVSPTVVSPTAAKPLAVPGAKPTTPGVNPAIKPAGEGKSAPVAVRKDLDTTVANIAKGREAEATGAGDGLSVRRALDRAYDSSMRPGDVASAPAGVAGKFSGAREKIAGFVGVANNSAPADAPGLYKQAIMTAEEALPAAAAAAVGKAVLAFAGRKADASLTDLVQAAYTAATAGQTSETKRLVKAVDKWEELLGSPGRPLITNGDKLKADVEKTLAGSASSKGSAPRVWVVKRGGSYVAALPGTTVAKIPGLAAKFSLKLESLTASPLADAYRAFTARPGARSAVGARVAMGDSVPTAILGTGWLWLKYALLRVWNGLLSMLPGRGLPTTADAATLPRLRAAAGSWRDAVTMGERAAFVAGLPRPTVSRVRGAFMSALRAAAAHEALTRESGALARIESLAAQFEAGVKRAALSPSDRLPPALETLVSGDGGLRHWAGLYAADARARGGEAFAKVRGAGSLVNLGDGAGALAAPSLLAASKDLHVVAFENSLWAGGSGSYGAVKLAADLRSTENGGSITLETQRADGALARKLDALGFAVTLSGAGLKAKLDAETASIDAHEMAALAADGAALIAGANRAAANDEPEGLVRLLSDVRRSPGDAAKKAAAFDGSSVLAHARPVAWVGELEAVEADIPSRRERVFALRDPATGLPKYARVETLRVK
ncbi:MAG: hypothetical protein HY923_06715 [Elusimicrobia bacterium]|nr:hypothetical protein [Elusimicrobiota bacterium]